MKTCSVPECEKQAISGQFCDAHRWRFRTHGDPLAGRTPVGEPLAFLRDLVAGKHGNECIVWPYARTVSGYGRVVLNGKTQRAHRVICEMMHGPAPTPLHQAAHSCGNGHLGCVSPNHLSWKTAQENQADRIAHGTDSRGERNGSSKLTPVLVQRIKGLRGAKSQSSIAKDFGISQTTVSAIQRGKSWQHVQVGDVA